MTSVTRSSLASRFGLALVVLGLFSAALSLLDPDLELPLVLGPSLAVVGALLRAHSSESLRRTFLPALLATGFALSAFSEPEFRLDSGAYYAYLRSGFFDGDLDFANELRFWGLREEPVTATGLRRNQHSIGPALLWSPFFLLAHGYVLATRALGLSMYSVDGFSTPYYRATALGTITVGVLGAWVLAGTLARRFAPGPAALAVFATVLSSSTIYYLLVLPTVSHGPVFGIACLTTWGLERTQREPSGQNWAVLGALLGLLSITRWQCAVFGLAAVVIALDNLRRTRLRPAWLLGGAIAGLIAIMPQLLTWHALFGTYLTVPQPASFFLDRPSRALDVLLHADHGLFVWTPLIFFASLGLLLSLRDCPALAIGGWLVFGASVLVNGSITAWAGSDSFGSRRFDLVQPFFAIGLCSLFVRMARFRWLAPVLMTLAFVTWNLGLVRLQRGLSAFPENAPLERLASLQAHQARRLASEGLGWLAGPRGRALAYKALVGEYLYYNVMLDGTIELARVPERFLAGGWSSAQQTATPPFRWAFHPKACVRLPLEEPKTLGAALLARSPGGIAQQIVGVSLNGSLVARRALTPAWGEVRFILPAAAMVPGENLLCFEFAESARAPGGDAVGMAVSRIQLP